MGGEVVRIHATALLMLLAWVSLIRADGPGDNLADLVRAVPPKGVAVPAHERAELEAGLAALGKTIETLASDLRPRPALLELLPDVEIYHKAVAYVLRYDEFF